MPEFEVTFRTSPLTDLQEALVLDNFEGFIGGHGDVTLVTVSMTANCGKTAGRELARKLMDAGIGIESVHSDLVTRAVIAERCKETRQAVGNWIRGDRLSSTPFPAPTNLVSGGVWRWQEVNDWLHDQGKVHDTDISYITAEDEVAVNYSICVYSRSARTGWRPVSPLSTKAHPDAAGRPATTTWRKGEVSSLRVLVEE